ncbi:unnamed protein product [Lupinus luteus]|uniref:WRKY domain-containing protein n=1 Tax=Lupinus luteus TaxID=3873 RepID=A0AAV1YMW0_LUPLU
MTNSFSDLFASTSERPSGFSGEAGMSVPKFMSIPPPFLPPSPSFISPSSYFVELLDSPVLLNSSNILSSTTGALAAQGFNWNNIKEDEYCSSFSFPTQPKPPLQSNVTNQTKKLMLIIDMFNFPGQQQARSFQESTTLESLVKTEYSSSMQSFTAKNANIQSNNNNNNNFQPQILSKRSDDGYNWRKYGQKQVKGSENPRSYYKCTYPNCPTKKKVERGLDGQITEIVYKGNHNHPKPQPQATKRNSSSLAIPPSNHVITEILDQSYATYGSGQMDLLAITENSSISMEDGDYEQSSQKSRSGADEDEPDPKRWRIEGENESISAHGSRTVREPRVVFHTTSDIDILDDGYRWRKYGQKVVKGNTNPRSYYKCTYPGCSVRKHIERAPQDVSAVITTYEGKHNHDVPAPRGSDNHSIDKNSSIVPAVSPYTVTEYPNNSNNNCIQNFRPQEGQSHFNQGMLKSPENFGLFGFRNPMESYIDQQSDNVFSSRAEEPRDDSFFDSLLR